MRIHLNKPPVGQALYYAIQNDCVSGMKTQKNADEADKTDTAKVDVSDKSKEIATIMAKINHLSDVRECRIEEIKQSIEAGMYTIDPRRIAEKMIRGNITRRTNSILRG
jgi:flagellar biosynthesis anti-sigma factor FlgM